MYEKRFSVRGKSRQSGCEFSANNNAGDHLDHPCGDDGAACTLKALVAIRKRENYVFVLCVVWLRVLEFGWVFLSSEDEEGDLCPQVSLCVTNLALCRCPNMAMQTTGSRPASLATGL